MITLTLISFIICQILRFSDIEQSISAMLVETPSGPTNFAKEAPSISVTWTIYLILGVSAGA